MMQLLNLRTILLALVLTACSRPPDQEQHAAQVPDSTIESQLHVIVEEFWEKYLALNPTTALFNGDYRFNDRFENNIGPDYRVRSMALEQDALQRLRALDPAQLTGQARLTFDVFKRDREIAIEGYRFHAELLPLNQYYSMASLLPQLVMGGLHPFESVKDYEDWLKRCADFERWVNQAIDNMRVGIAKGIVQPQPIMQKVVPQLAAMIVDDPRQSVFYKPVENFPDGITEAERTRLTVAFVATIRDQVVPSYRRLHDFVLREYLPECRTSVGLSDLPQGPAWYAYQVKVQTTSARTPDEIHRIGLAEVARIRGEMEKVMHQVGHSGDLKTFIAELRRNPRFYYGSEQELLDGYHALQSQVRAELPKIFSVVPQAALDVRPVEPFRAASAAAGQYLPGSPDGKRPAVFYVNTYGLDSRPKYSMEALYLHEAEPGHHLQFSIQQALDLPRFRRFGSYSAYAEGWGLYAESLGYELGRYTDPYSRFGALSFEIARAVRLVVDTGMHARGWTREQAIAYMAANTAISANDVVAEIERYIVLPGQALSYKIGELKIKELRARANAALGAAFDVKEFHAQLLGDGALPLDVLEAKLDRWIADRRAALPSQEHSRASVYRW